MEDLNGKVNLFMMLWKFKEMKIFLICYYEYFFFINKDWIYNVVLGVLKVELSKDM